MMVYPWYQASSRHLKDTTIRAQSQVGPPSLSCAKVWQGVGWGMSHKDGSIGCRVEARPWIGARAHGVMTHLLLKKGRGCG
jgi:hypothetical protein